MALVGAKEMKAELRSLRSGSGNAMRTAVYAGATQLRTAERQAAPRATGRSVRKIIAKRHRGTPTQAKATVEVTRAGFYLKILEVGAKAHRIGLKSVHSIIHRTSRKTIGKATGRRALAIGKGFGRGTGRFIFRRSVSHPGTRARHWFRTTYERERTNILASIENAFATYVAKSRKKVGA